MKDFLTTEEEQAVVDEIREAEKRTSGEIRLVITTRWILRPERHGWKLFHRLGMDGTRNHNGALILVLTRRRRFVVLGDRGLNAVVDSGYWRRIAGEMTEGLRAGRKVDALASAIRTLGATMAAHWPPEDENPDELSNEIHRD